MRKSFCVMGLFLFGLFSCKSEYEERLAVGMKLKNRMFELESNRHFDANFKIQELKEIKKELAFHAKISGNEIQFFKQLNLDKSEF